MAKLKTIDLSIPFHYQNKRLFKDTPPFWALDSSLNDPIEKTFQNWVI